MNTARYEGLIIAALLLIAFLYFGSNVFPRIQTVLEKSVKFEVKQSLVAKS